LTEYLLKNLDFKKGNGLMPVVVQDAESKEVLMLAYANEEALEKTLNTGYAHYWSRSRKKLWMKGETSGHIQKIKQVMTDCDYDTLLYVVKQKGPACHTGKYTCFYNKLKL
jgi:phosphoribosyl-AMP cyclohydrolase